MRTHELRLTASVVDIIEALKVVKGQFHRELLTSLHDIVTSGAKLTREELLSIKQIATDMNFDLMIMDCDSRIRNLVGN